MVLNKVDAGFSLVIKEIYFDQQLFSHKQYYAKSHDTSNRKTANELSNNKKLLFVGCIEV